MDFKSFLLSMLIACSLCVVNADLIGYNRFLNRYNGHIMAQRRDNNRLKGMKNLIQQYRLFFDMTVEN